jgi:hypothetical protein
MEWKAFLRSARDLIRWCLRICIAPVVSVLAGASDLCARWADELAKI